MKSVQQTIHEVSDLWDFARRMGWLDKTPQYQEARLATANWPKNPVKPLDPNAAAPPSNPTAIRNGDPLLRKVSDLRDLCNQVPPLNAAHRPKIAGHSLHPAGSKRIRESSKIPPAPIIRHHRPGK